MGSLPENQSHHRNIAIALLADPTQLLPFLTRRVLTRNQTETTRHLAEEASLGAIREFRYVLSMAWTFLAVRATDQGGKNCALVKSV
jgi:hypothetical protein